MDDIKNKIRAYSKKIDIDCIGFTTAAPFLEIEQRLKMQYEKGYISGFEEKEIQKRIYPQLTMANSQSLIAIAMAYPSRTRHEKDQKRRGYFASASYGADYHVILREKMELLCAYIQSEFGVVSHGFSDTGPLVDTAVAKRAGLGFIGKNGLLITKEYGSYVYLGYIMSELKVEPDEEVDDGCGTCTKCVTSCPTNALFGNGSMDAKKCLAYQTQKKGVIAEPYRSKMGKMLYGCDICQMVCPYNKRKDHHIHEEMEPVYEDVAPELSKLFHMTKKEFQSQFGYMAGSWRGVHVIRRNALIVARNIKAIELIPEIQKRLEVETRPEIRVTALEAIGRLTGEIPKQYVQEIAEGVMHTEYEIAQGYLEIQNSFIEQ